MEYSHSLQPTKKIIALTTANVVDSLKELDEGKLSQLGNCLGVPESNLMRIKNEFLSFSDKLNPVVQYFLDYNPDSSWRAVVSSLIVMNEPELFDKLRGQCEPVTDHTLTLEAVTDVLGPVCSRNWLSGSWLVVPDSVRKKIRSEHHTDRSRKAAIAKHFLEIVPGASWTIIAEALYSRKETAALEKIKSYLGKEKDSSLTLDKVLTVLDGVARCDTLGVHLRIPVEQCNDICSKSKEMKPIVIEWLQSHPAPSWKCLARALYAMHEEIALQKIYRCFIKAPPTVRRLNNLQEVMKEKGSRDESVIQTILVGPPRSGKSSLKDRLLGRPAQQHSSTGVADKVVRIDIDVAHISGRTWKAMTDLDDESTALIQGIPEEVTNKIDSPSERDQHALTVPLPEHSSAQQASPLVDMQPIPDTSTQPVQSASENASNSGDICDPLNEFREAFIKASRQEKIESICTEKHLTLYLTDSGGQPEFQGLLRSVVSGPTLFFIVFQLNKDLNTKFVVEYKHPNGRLATPYETSFTTKETLLQLLATISSVGSFTKTEDEKEVQLTPKALFVGTHRDKLASREQFLAIDRELQELIKTTDAYRDGLIEFASREQLILPINNLSEDDGDVKEIRAAVERIGRRGKDYEVRIPYPTLVFGIVIRYLKDPILRYKDCFEIARRCGMESADEFDDALWFLHHRVGVIRYFSDVPELRDLVIKSPQYIFDRVTDLVVSTFTFENVPHNILAEFCDRGIFQFKFFEKLTASQNTALSAKQLVCLLEHLHVIAPLSKEAEAGTRYFAPFVLAHAQDAAADNTSSPSDITLPPLLLSFKSGYCPTGMFGVLVVHLLGSCKKTPLEWTLDEDTIFHDQITLSIGPYDAFTFTVLPSHIRIQLAWSTPTSDRSRLPLGGVCSNVRSCIEGALWEVIQHLNYTNKAEHSLGFQCPHPLHYHAALINYVEGQPINLKCCLAKKRFDLPPGCKIWFGEVLVLANETHVHQLAALLQPVAGCWSLFLGQLGLPPSSMELIATNNAGRPNMAMLCLVEGLTLWVRSHEKPAFKSISEVLRGRVLPNMTLAADIEAFSTRI